MRSPPSFDYHAALQHCLSQQQSNIGCHKLNNGETVWVRKAGSRNPAWRYRLLGGLAKALKLDVLTPIPNLGGHASIATEALRLHTLAAAGIAVPPLLAQQNDAFMMGNVGQHNLFNELRQHISAPATLLQRWQLGLDAIAQVHQRGHYLSQAFARNLMYNQGHIAFIDFEDDPGQVLPLSLCQARDWLCYLHSSAHLLQQSQTMATAISVWQQTLANSHSTVRLSTQQALQRLRPLRHLRADFWGKDTLKLANMAAFGQ